MTPESDSPEQALAPTPSAEKKIKPATAQLRGEVMAFAVQSAAFNLAANIFEPYLSYRIQKHYSAKSADGKPPTYGNYSQNLGGELAGDLTGAAALILAEAVCPEPLHAITRRARKCVDPLYTSVAQRVFASERESPDYEKKVEEWKTFQERNLVRSVIIAGAGIAGNVAAQKYIFNNPSPTGLVFAGKLASTALTTAIGLTMRLAYPEKMHHMDAWISKKFFVPIIGDSATASSHAERLQQQSNKNAETQQVH